MYDGTYEGLIDMSHSLTQQVVELAHQKLSQYEWYDGLANYQIPFIDKEEIVKLGVEFCSSLIVDAIYEQHGNHLLPAKEI